MPRSPILKHAPTIVSGDFEWDDRKAQANLAKHRISFEEAATVFADPRVVILDDGGNEGRLVAVGLSARLRLLCVVHVQRGERDRIVSARRATAADETVYALG
jgi:uncharacterized DUF497 family protein